VEEMAIDKSNYNEMSSFLLMFLWVDRFIPAILHSIFINNCLFRPFLLPIG